MSYTMDGDTYDMLYKRYLTRSPSELLELAGMKTGDVVLDLCAGSNCIVTKEAFKKGAAKVISIDPNVPLRKYIKDLKYNTMFIPIQTSVEQFLYYYDWDFQELQIPDIVICRQGVNYWVNEDTIKRLSSNLVSGSVFVFNTFSNKPSTKPSIKQYEIDGRHYVEVWHLKDDMVYHVQVVDGLEPHLTNFRWISPEEYDAILNPYFDVKIHRDKKSVIYICKRK